MIITFNYIDNFEIYDGLTINNISVSRDRAQTEQTFTQIIENNFTISAENNFTLISKR